MALLSRATRVQGLLRVAIATFALCIAGLAALAWLSGDGAELAVEYEGFD